MNKTILIALAIMVAAAANAQALGITPGLTKSAYTPGEEQTVTFSVTNTEEHAIKAALYSQGEIPIATDQETIDLAPKETKELAYRFTAPENLEPGTRNGMLVIKEIAEDTEGITATVSVATRLEVQVPHEGKEISAEIGLQPLEENTMQFVISVTNLGTEEIQDLHAEIHVLGEDLQTENINLEPQRRTELKTEWEAPTGGEYEATVSIIYDGKTRILTRKFDAAQGTSDYHMAPGEETRNRWLSPAIIIGLSALAIINASIYVRRRKRSKS